MKTFEPIRQVVDKHAQMRIDSCGQSAVEMVLKLYGILGQNEYPEQAFADRDCEGFVHDAQLGQATYNDTKVTFTEEKFDAKLQPNNWKAAAWQRGVALLA